MDDTMSIEDIVIINKPTKKSAGRAIINGKVCHFMHGRWVICGDCNNLNNE